MAHLQPKPCRDQNRSDVFSLPLLKNLASLTHFPPNNCFLHEYVREAALKGCSLIQVFLNVTRVTGETIGCPQAIGHLYFPQSPVALLGMGAWEAGALWVLTLHPFLENIVTLSN